MVKYLYEFKNVQTLNTVVTHDWGNSSSVSAAGGRSKSSDALLGTSMSSHGKALTSNFCRLASRSSDFSSRFLCKKMSGNHVGKKILTFFSLIFLICS